ncbi:hypothetical protein E3N88_09990 [Mikania micrantha]|uniref:Uncharacterized protein n=1 Tax=Mikania micrantha TaxID=192012 RepID=A0A5N6PAJ2_9ASTR|nr:hypothetical protein E3N88_09990 [Mikania micrantha]
MSSSIGRTTYIKRAGQETLSETRGVQVAFDLLILHRFGVDGADDCWSATGSAPGHQLLRSTVTCCLYDEELRDVPWACCVAECSKSRRTRFRFELLLVQCCIFTPESPGALNVADRTAG